MRFLILFFTLVAALAHADGYAIANGNTTQALTFLMVSNSDHIAGATSQTVTVKLSKNGAAGGAPNCACTATEVDSTNMPGLYKLSANATDANTNGPLILHATASGADPTDVIYQVVAYNPLDATRMGLTALPNANAGASNGVVTYGTGTGQLNPASGNVTVGTNNDKTGYTASTVSDKSGYSLSTSQTFNTTGSTGSVTSPVTVGTNNDKTGYSVSTNSDKTGYSLSASQTFSTTGACGSVTSPVTVGTNNDKTGYTASTVSDKSGYSLSTSQTFNTSGSVGAATSCNALGTQAKTDVGASVDGSSNVGAIKAKTDQLTFTVGNKVDSNAQYMNNSKINGTGLSTDKFKH